MAGCGFYDSSLIAEEADAGAGVQHIMCLLVREGVSLATPWRGEPQKSNVGFRVTTHDMVEVKRAVMWATILDLCSSSRR